MEYKEEKYKHTMKLPEGHAMLGVDDSSACGCWRERKVGGAGEV